MRVAQRKLGQKVRLYLLRLVLNMMVLCLLGGAFYLIDLAIRNRVSPGEERALNGVESN